VIFISISLILFSYLISYPVTYNQEEGNTYSNFYPLLWLILSISFFLIIYMLFNFNNKFLSMILSLIFVILFTSPSFFYYTAGSDSAGGYFGLLESTLVHNIGDSFLASFNYSQWPALLAFTLIVSKLICVPLNEVQKITMFSIIFVVVSNMFVYFSKKNSKPGINVAMYFMAFYLFLNWQPVPQVFGLALFLTLINLLNKDSEHLILLIITFIPLVFTHAFMGILFIFSIFLIALIQRFSILNYHKKYSTPLLVLLTIQVFYIVYLATSFFQTLIHMFIRNNSMSSQELTAGQELAKYGVVAMASRPVCIVDILTKNIAIFNFLLLMFILLISVALSIKRTKFQPIDFSLFFTGGIFFVLGMFSSILGFRGLQICAIAVANQIEIFDFGKYSKAIMTLILLVALLFPANMIRMNYDYTSYLTDVDRYDHNFLVEKLKSENIIVGDIKTPDYYLITNGIDGGVIANLQPGYIQYLSPPDNYYVITHLNNASLVILYNEKFTAELKKFPHPVELDERYVSSNYKFNKIYDTFYQRAYIS
jgi:hypothetical protein